MKLRKKVLIINLIICLIIFFGFEVAFFIKGKNAENLEQHKFINIPQNISYENIMNINKDEPELNSFTEGQYNSGEKYKNKNNSIILMGCSFAYSWGLKYKDSFAYQLSEKTKRPVYMRANPASGPNESLYIVSNEKFYSQHDEPEYVIYLFIENHFSRMFSEIYSLQSNKLRPIWNIDEKYNSKKVFCWYKPLFLSHIFKYIYREKVTLNYGIIDEEKYFNTMMAIKKNINKHWKDTKFIVIRYSEPNIEKPYLFSENLINKFKENKVIYIDADEIVFGNSSERLIGEKYSQENQHPSAYAFELLSDALSKKL